MRKEIFIIQAQLFANEKWYDLTTFGDTLEEAREELQEVKKTNYYPLRIIKRVTTVENFVME